MRRPALPLATLAALLPLASAPLQAQWRSREPPPSAAAPVLPPEMPAAFAPVPKATGQAAVDRDAAPPFVLLPRLAEGSVETRPGPDRVLLGSVLGGAVGIVVGGTAGASLFGECTDPGNPDSCLSQLQYGAIGAYWGNTVGAPVGAHLMNGRRGSLGRSLAASTGLAVAGAVALRAGGFRANEADSRVEPRFLVPLVVLGVPIAQVFTAAAIESRSGRR